MASGARQSDGAAAVRRWRCLVHGILSHVGWDLAAAAATWLTWIYVAILGQVLLMQPDGRVRSTIVVVLTVGLYLVALGSPPDAPIPLAAGLALALAVRRAVAGRDPRRGSADAIGLVVAAALAAGPLLEVLAPGLRLNAVALWLATVAGAAVLLAADTIRVAPVLGRVTDIVVRLDPRTPISVAGELRRATGDPTLELGFRRADGEGFVDAAGRPIQLPDPGTARVATAVGPEERPNAVVVYDGRLGTDTALVAATAQAVALESANARLQSELRDQLHEVRVSRRRLLIVGDEERRALERRLAGDLLPDLKELGGLLERTRARPRRRGGPSDRPGEARAGRRARGTDGSGRWAPPRGARHRRPDGGPAAAGRPEPDPVSVSIDDLPTLPSVVDTSAYFVCSEALANVAKHAAATHASISVGIVGDLIELVIADDGRGGADPAAGTGLVGLRDRVEALGGSLQVESVRGSGTRLRALLPLPPTARTATAT